MIKYDPKRTVPNWAPGAAEFLAAYLEADYTCFEWGGGQSTAWLARHVPQGAVVTVEHDLEWLRRTVELTRDLDNCQIIYAPCENVDKPSQWMMRYVNAIDVVQWPNVYLVDGFLRPECMAKALRLARPNDIVVLDDALDYVGDLTRPKATFGRVFQMPHPNKGERNLWGRMSPDFKETWVFRMRSK